ncbi:hypothetical protein APHAL10511_005610 [Amanita phalloides]|nr:hypothetical protein APHAL10511_005610 [Amanita phalloides]
MASSWLPVHGTHQLNIGTSLRRALKARKNNGENKPSAPAKRLPDRDFYAFRYNFKPNSIDRDRPGSIDIRKTSDSTMITVEYPSKQSGETHVFHGSENVAKEWDCALVYDEELGTFTLEKLDSHAALKHERKLIATRPPPPPASPPKVKDDLEAQLEKDLLDLANPDADAEGEDDFDEIVPKHISYGREEEEEEDNALEELIVPTPPPKQAPPRPKAQAKAPAKVRAKEPQPQRKEPEHQRKESEPQRKEPEPQRTVKLPAKGKGKAPAVPRPSSTNLSTTTKSAVKPPTVKSRQVPVPVPARALTPATIPASTPPPQPQLPQTQTQTQAQVQVQAPVQAQAHSKPSKKREPEPVHLSDADEEVLEFGKPAKRTRKMSPVAPVSSGLALPGTSSFVVPPPLIPSASSSTSSTSSSRPLATVVAEALPSVGDGGETESEWDEVDPEAMMEGDDFFGDGGMDDDDIEAELNQQMAEMEEEEEELRGAPMSLNDYARGVAGLSDDESSTSDESDDD